MKPEHVQDIHQRASDVVNGFATVRVQQARDVLTLTTYIAELEHSQQVLIKRLQEFSDKNVDKHSPYAETFDNLFKDIWKKK